MSIISILKSFWKGKAISVRSVVRLFGVSKIDARVRLNELAYEKGVLREVKKDLFIGVGDKEEFIEEFESVFQDCIEDENTSQDVADALF